MKRLLDAIADRLGYIPEAESHEIADIYARRVIGLGDEIDVLKRRIVNLTGMVAAADDNAAKTVFDLTRQLRVEQSRRGTAENKLTAVLEAISDFRAAIEDF